MDNIHPRRVTEFAIIARVSSRPSPAGEVRLEVGAACFAAAWQYSNYYGVFSCPSAVFIQDKLSKSTWYNDYLNGILNMLLRILSVRIASSISLARRTDLVPAIQIRYAKLLLVTPASRDPARSCRIGAVPKSDL